MAAIHAGDSPAAVPRLVMTSRRRAIVRATPQFRVGGDSPG